MSWIKTISYAQASGKLKKFYERVSGPDNNVDNIMIALSLRPHTLEGHMALYKNVLHHNANQLATHQLEALGVYVSMLNQCNYCVEHHYQGYKRLLKDNGRALLVRQALQSGDIESAFSKDEATLFHYANKLTLKPGSVNEGDLQAMRSAGYDDGIIVEVNQVVAYFNYANRTVLGLGVTIEGDVMGLSPDDSDDPDSWGHT